MLVDNPLFKSDLLRPYDITCIFHTIFCVDKSPYEPIGPDFSTDHNGTDGRTKVRKVRGR